MESNPLALIVEDNKDQNWVFTLAVQQAGFQAESILDGQQAYQRLGEIVPNLLILDLQIPGVSGEKLLREVRANPQTEKAFVILATADALKAEELRSIADLVLLKPISFNQLSDLAKRYRETLNV